MTWENIKNLLESTVHGFADWIAPEGPLNLDRSRGGGFGDGGEPGDPSGDLEAGLRALDQYHRSRDTAVAARQSDRRPFRLPTLWELNPRSRSERGPVQTRDGLTQLPGEVTKVEVPRSVAHYSGLPMFDLLTVDESVLGSTTNRGTFEETTRSTSVTQIAEIAPSVADPIAYGGVIGGVYGGLLHPINEGLYQCVDPAYAPYAVTVADTAVVYGLHTWYGTAGGMPLAESNVAFAEGGPAIAAAATMIGHGVHTALEAAGVDTASNAGKATEVVATGAGTGAAAAWMWPYLASSGPLGFGVGAVMYVLSDWQNNARAFTEAVDHALDDTSLEWCDPLMHGECVLDTLEVAKDVVVDGVTGLYHSAAYVFSGEALADGYDWATDQIGYELCVPFYNCD